MMSERESHGMNCAHRSDSDEPCTCACRYHAAVDTERTMHAAWRKRAEEAERENADLRARLEAAEKDRDNELADNTGLALKCAALAEECDNFKALASRETSRRLDAVLRAMVDGTHRTDGTDGAARSSNAESRIPNPALP